MQDLFRVSMAVSIVTRLTFGTLITIAPVPTLYAVFYRFPSPSSTNHPGNEPTHLHHHVRSFPCKLNC